MKMTLENTGDWRCDAEIAAWSNARRRRAKPKIPEWAGIAEPFITKCPDDLLAAAKSIASAMS